MESFVDHFHQLDPPLIRQTGQCNDGTDYVYVVNAASFTTLTYGIQGVMIYGAVFYVLMRNMSACLGCWVFPKTIQMERLAWNPLD